MARFWMVWRTGNYPPVKMHSSEVDAEQEAKRLAMKHPEELFYVLETKSVTSGIVNITFTAL